MTGRHDGPRKRMLANERGLCVTVDDQPSTEKRGKKRGRRRTDREVLEGRAPGTNKKPGHEIHELLVDFYSQNVRPEIS